MHASLRVCADVTFALSEYVVEEEAGTLGIRLSAELTELAPTEDEVATTALSAFTQLPALLLIPLMSYTHTYVHVVTVVL